MDAVALAAAILDCGAEGPAALRVLSLAPALPPVTANTPVAEARRNYMRLAGLVHPDKLQSRFDRATEAFQRLVQAFERVADPKFRKQLLAQQAREEKKQQQGKKTGDAAEKKAVKRTRVQKKEEPAVKRQKSSKYTRETKNTQNKSTNLSDDFIDYDNDDLGSTDQEEEESSEEYDEVEDVEINFEDLEPTVSTSRVLLGTKRTGGIYRDTKVSCPQCRTQWVPDSKQHYTLFMGPAGKKVHCETCLCRFGCATALHSCPHCSGNFDYDVSMYDETIECNRCNQTIGFPYYPVNQQLIDLVKLEEWREQEEAKRTRERDERAARRNQSEDGTSEEFHQLLGTCIVNEICPLCQRTITSRHRQHIDACLKTKGSKTKVSKPPVVSVEKPKRKTSVSSKKSITPSEKTKAVKSAPPKPKIAEVENKNKKTTKKTVRRRRRGSDSTDSEDDESSFASSSENDDE
ncbi:hypothetical protein LSM04_001496 [Trypanosoma melophagium]|uniref:uncharacterized protein n=1 Tax=Trypanosoma melophagium TaxID=715481 RepID=UPI00351A5DED|nr:hypothetical protein LSM04_001496 [Trypanosoma melophagium]